MSTTVFDQTTALAGTDDGGGNTNLNLRQVIPAALLSAAVGTQIRVTVAFGSAEGSELPAVDDFWVGQQGGAATDFNGHQVQCTFSSGVPINGSAGGVITSDWITLGEAYDNTKAYVFAFHGNVSASFHMATAVVTGAQIYWEFPGNVSSSSSTTASLGNTTANTLSFIQKIEIQSSGGGSVNLMPQICL